MATDKIRELTRDSVNVVYNFTPLSGIVALGKFIKKWGGETFKYLFNPK